MWVPGSRSTFLLRVGNRAGGHLVQRTQVAPDLGDGGEVADEPPNRDLRTASCKELLEVYHPSIIASAILELIMCTDFC